MRLWVVALIRSGTFPNVVWDLQGVFSTREKAEAVCKDHLFCVIPIELDEEYSIDPVGSSEDHFPKSPSPLVRQSAKRI
jgi:hypothetical protein